MSGRKKKVKIYVNPNTQTTNALMDFIADNIDEISRRIIIDRVRVTRKNFQTLKDRGITKTPTLVYDGKQYVGAQKIMRILKPPSAHKDNFGSNLSAEEMVQRFHMRAIAPDEQEGETPDEDDPNNRTSMLRQRMAAFQKKRDAMLGFGDNPPIPGGKPPRKGRAARAKSFNNDEDFMSAMDAVEETPTEMTMTEEDGDRILEDERNRLADEMGRKVGRTVSRRR